MPVGSHTASWLRPKTVVFAAIAAMMVYVVQRNERFLIEPSNPIWTHYAEIAWWLVPHGIAGACAMLLVPLQFSERLRKRYTAAHRVIGRIYVAGALMLAPLGAYIQDRSEASGYPREFTVLAIVDAVLLTSTTLVAFFFAVRRRITLHRQWMTRSYAVALVFFESRLLDGLTGLTSVEASMTIIWSCLAFSLLFAEVVNSFDDIRTAVAAPRRERVAVARVG